MLLRGQQTHLQTTLNYKANIFLAFKVYFAVFITQGGSFSLGVRIFTSALVSIG